jgi:hypothetical protein
MRSLLPVDFVREDVVEVVGCHETIVVQIRLYEDTCDFLLAQILAQLLCDLLQLVGGDPSLHKWTFTALL